MLVRLRARRPHGGPFGLVEHAKLNPRRVRRETHFAAQRIDLADHMSFGKPSDRGIARHSRDGVRVHGNHKNGESASCDGKGRFDARVSGTYYDCCKLGG